MSTDTNVTPITAPTPARAQALKTMNQIVSARARMVGAQSGPTAEQALAVASGGFVVVGPWEPLRYVSNAGGWTLDVGEALIWHSTADLLRACYKLNVSGLRIIGAPTVEDLIAARQAIAQGNATRAAALNATKARNAAKRAKRLASIRGTETQPTLDKD